jgi:putative ABC transport system ATP-binding protein
VDIAEVPSVEHRRRVMMLSQNPVLFPGNIRDNLEVGFRLQKTEAPGEARLREILSQVRLDKDLDGPCEQLSGGERQRLVLARVCLLDPEVYLLDEPSAALDEAAEDEIVGMAKAHIRSEGKSAVMVTHSRRVAERYADDLLVMGKGGHTWRA